MSISDNLKALRNKFNYSQEEVADRLKISRQTYIKIEQGAKELGADLLINLSRIFETSVDVILGSDIEMERKLKNVTVDELRDYLYINIDKLQSFLGSLGHSDIQKIMHSMNKEGAIGGEAKLGLPFVGTIDTSISQEREHQQQWEEVKRIENYANLLISELTNRQYIYQENISTVPSGKFIKINSKIEIVNALEGMRSIFKLIPFIESTINQEVIPSNYKPFLSLIERDIEEQNGNLLIKTYIDNIPIYSKLKPSFFTNPSDVEVGERTASVIGKVLRYASSQESLISLPSLNVMPKDSVNQLVQSFSDILANDNKNFSLFYEDGAIILDTLFIYQ